MRPHFFQWSLVLFMLSSGLFSVHHSERQLKWNSFVLLICTLLPFSVDKSNFPVLFYFLFVVEAVKNFASRISTLLRSPF